MGSLQSLNSILQQSRMWVGIHTTLTPGGYGCDWALQVIFAGEVFALGAGNHPKS